MKPADSSSRSLTAFRRLSAGVCAIALSILGAVGVSPAPQASAAQDDVVVSDSAADDVSAPDAAVAANALYVKADWEHAYAYVYTTERSNRAWPGVEMTKIEGTDACGQSGFYYAVPDNLAAGSEVIFHDGTGSNDAAHRYPLDLQGGMAYSGGRMVWNSGRTALDVVSCGAEVADVASVSVSPVAQSIAAGETARLTADPEPADGTADGATWDRTVTWSTSDAQVAIVSMDGVVTGVNTGTATITATATNGVKGTAEITVTESSETTTNVLYVDADWDQVYAYVYQLGSEPIKSNAEWPGVPMRKSGTADACGQTAYSYVLPSKLASGARVIFNDGKDNGKRSTPDFNEDGSQNPGLAYNGGRVKWTSGATSLSAVSCGTAVPVTGVSVSPSSRSVDVGSTARLSATIAPDNATDKAVTWTSADPSIATVAADGVVTGVKSGRTTVTATANGQSSSITVTVSAPNVLYVDADSVAEWGDTVYAYVYRGDEAKNADWPGVAMTAVSTASDVCNQTGYYYEIPSNLLTAAGTHVIFHDNAGNRSTPESNEDGSPNPGLAYTGGRVKWTAGAASLSTLACIAATGVSITPASPTILAGSAVGLQAEVTPDTTTNKAVTWASSDEKIATVDEDGIVTAVAEGTATITATTASGRTATATVTVTPFNGVTIAGEGVSDGKASVAVGGTLALTATTDPAGQKVTWESSDSAIASVDADGKVTGVAEGTATITAAARGKSATVTVTVDDTAGYQEMYRLYNVFSGEHFYTASEEERDNLRNVGWSYEGVGWIAPKTSGTPVYRVYNPFTGDHHYTVDKGEYESLKAQGWGDEGIGWYSAENEGSVPLYREYNPFAVTGSHNYTLSQEEHNSLVKAGWNDEGEAWRAVSSETDINKL